MVIRKRDDGQGVSLFPFLSILACVIGTLTLMIASVALGQIEYDQSPEVIGRAQEYGDVQGKIEATQEELERLRALLANASKLKADLRAAKDELNRLESKYEQDAGATQKVQADLTRLLAELNRLRKRYDEIKGDPPRLDKQIADLEIQLQRRENPQSMAKVQIRPGGSGINLKPVFVECAANSIIVLESEKPKPIRVGDVGKADGEFRKLLDRVAGRKHGTIIFLIRPDGVGSFRTAYGVARGHYGPNGYCPNGKLPVPTHGQIDLSLFAKDE